MSGTYGSEGGPAGQPAGPTRLIDLSINAPTASVSAAQVTATPTNYIRGLDYATSEASPVLVVGVPDLEPLTIGCPRSWFSCDSRFAWRDKVPRSNAPDYLVSGADWPTLVQTFGLAPRLAERFV